MALNLSTNDGEFTPYLKYNAKAGRWFAKDENGTEIEIPNPRLAIDMENVKTGWICFPTGSAPIYAWDDTNGMRPPRPAPVGGNNYKEGFEVNVFGPDKQPGFGGKPLGIRQWTSTANVAKNAFILLHGEFEKNTGDNPGMIPVFQVTGQKLVKGMHGDNFEPTFILQDWIERDKVPAFAELLAKAAPGPTGWPAANGEASTEVGEEIDDEIPF